MPKQTCFLKLDIAEVLKHLSNASHKTIRVLARMFSRRDVFLTNDENEPIAEDGGMSYSAPHQIILNNLVKVNLYRRNSLEGNMAEFLRALNEVACVMYVPYKKSRCLDRAKCEKKADLLLYGSLNYELFYSPP